MGVYARLLSVQFPEKLVVNPAQNPRYPFIRHDLPDQHFPWAGADRGLRLLRLPSVFFGLITLLATWTLLWRLFPERTVLRRMSVAVTMLMPNTLQICSVVANDGLCMALSTTAAALAVIVLKWDSGEPPAALCIALGAALGLAFLTKITAVQVVIALALVFVVDAFTRRDRHWSLRVLAFAGVPAALLASIYFAAGIHHYGTAMPDMAGHLFSGNRRAEPMPLSRLVLPFIEHYQKGFAAELCWISVRLPEPLSALLFWLGAVALAAGLAVVGKAKQPALVMMPVFTVVVSVVLLMLHNREFSNFQVRHFWLVLPLAIPAVGYATLLLQRDGPRKAITTVGIFTLLLCNGLVLQAFTTFYRDCPDDSADRDYHAYLYAFHLNKARGDSYLRWNTFARYDVDQATVTQDWHSVVQSVIELQSLGIAQPGDIAVLASAYKELGEADSMLVKLEPLIESTPQVHLLYANLLAATGKREEAVNFISQILSKHSGGSAENLKRLQESLEN
jgi:hypothetical protein